jgi:hypothetical protein
LPARQGLSGKHNCLVGGPLKAILPPHSHLALRSALSEKYGTLFEFRL